MMFSDSNFKYFLSLDYSEFAKTTPIIGVWDDHDYGVNNGDRTFSKKDQVRDIFLDFINEPQDSDRRLEKNTGIY